MCKYIFINLLSDLNAALGVTGIGVACTVAGSACGTEIGWALDAEFVPADRRDGAGLSTDGVDTIRVVDVTNFQTTGGDSRDDANLNRKWEALDKAGRTALDAWT